MFELLGIVMINERKDYYFSGVLYDSKNEKVRKIFDDGTHHTNMNDPFTLILNESSSLLDNRILTDKIASSTSNTGFLFLISPKAQEFFIEHAADDIQMFDVEIKGSNFELNDYKIVKIVDKIKCLDFEKSDLDYSEGLGYIRNAEKLVLKENLIPEKKLIFLLGDHPTGIILIKKDLKAKMMEAGLTGFSSYSLDEAFKVL